MLAVETGWTPATIATLPARFRLAAHWVMYVRSLIGTEGLPEVPDLPTGPGVDPMMRLRFAEQRKNLDRLRAYLFPEETDGDQ